MTIIQTLKPLLLPFVPKSAPNEQDTLERNIQHTASTSDVFSESQTVQQSSQKRSSFWSNAYIHLTGSIMARYTPVVIVPVPTSEANHH
ncbi:hypothetical protein ACE3MZ_18685 [Paenibacillus sp. WLX1005]|uniref:hypothetical protein n=1 Tax=unclassified Paenibacillus TaxID=185978 RepID=UPI0039842240